MIILPQNTWISQGGTPPVSVSFTASTKGGVIKSLFLLNQRKDGPTVSYSHLSWIVLIFGSKLKCKGHANVSFAIYIGETRSYQFEIHEKKVFWQKYEFLSLKRSFF